MSDFLENINKSFFWDIDPNFLDEDKSSRLIIERVMNYGNLNDIKMVREHYGDDKITKTVCNLNYIDPKTLNFISLLFDIPKTKFKCYIRKQLTNQHWNF